MFGFGFTNLCTLAGAVSGGSWLAGAPASNILTRDLAEVARSSDALAASTKMIIDWGSAQDARALAITFGNLSAAAQIRWSRGSTSGGNEVVAGDLTDAWAINSADGSTYHNIVLHAATTSARYELIEIVDTANADGYVEMARLFIGDLTIHQYGPEAGLQDVWRDHSTVERSDSASLWSTRRRRLRSASFVLPALTLDEADAMHDMQQRVGTTEEVLYLPYMGDAAAMQRYGMVGVLEELSPIEYPYYRRRKLPLRITQI